ncbi:MAG: UTP--glucose-1-phosphate uridylyltransferase [Bryobacteraceae bacterium]|jgi:hypothetical protein
MSRLIDVIASHDPAIRNAPLDAIANSLSVEEMLAECEALDAFRRHSDNLYGRVRAEFFLYALHRFHFGARTKERPQKACPTIPFPGYVALLRRRFDEAIDIFLASQSAAGPNEAISSALAAAYRALGFQTLADQVRRSVRSVRGNQWMFRTGHPDDYPLRIRPELFHRPSADALFPILAEATPVRMDLSHSGWSDIFFLGMDFPEGARVLNISVDLSVCGSGAASPRPPVEAYLRVIDEPVLRLTSVDLRCSADIRSIAEIFDFAQDYLGLLKAAIIASGLIPSGLEGSTEPLESLLARLTGQPGHGIEIVSKVNGIPKGSRLAVSTTLLASLIGVCMRATGQIRTLTGTLEEEDRRLVAARAILGEWLGGSGGGWQDSGGVWPGIKLIQGVLAGEDDAEFGISRGRLLPRHTILDSGQVSPAAREKLQNSLVLVHGGMAQDVGPILEMVTERYLLRSESEWNARKQAIHILDEVLGHLRAGGIAAVGDCTQRNFDGPIQDIIPWAGNLYTQTLIDRARENFGPDFWGFWMLGGMAGGGMGFLFDPHRKPAAQDWIASIMHETKRQLEHAVPFAMEPVVYDFSINDHGTTAALHTGPDAMMPPDYYMLAVPPLLRSDIRQLSPARRVELNHFSAARHSMPEFAGIVDKLFEHLLPEQQEEREAQGHNLRALLEQHGFDPIEHEAIQQNMRAGRLGLSQNRLPISTTIEDVSPNDIFDATSGRSAQYERTGHDALARGEVAVLTFAGGIGTRWTHGAGVVKALNPFCKIAGRHRGFIELHLAKSRKVSHEVGACLPHVITTSYLTYDAIASFLEANGNYGYPGPVLLSPGRSIGLRFIPMERDLRFAWEEMPQQLLDEQAQKVRDSGRASLINWAKRSGEGSDYIDNLPMQCLHPVGHWYEIPNLFRNGVLLQLFETRPQLKYLMVHNVDTVGVSADAALLGYHIAQGSAMTTEVVARQIEDRGGGLARVDGRVRLVEGLAFPNDEVESEISYYNSATSWIDIDKLLAAFGLVRADLTNQARVTEAVRAVAARMPTYITLKDVKKRWGKGQEDVFPVAQFEKLWGDMTALPELTCSFVVVPRERGQQLKEPAQLDQWLRDGSAAYVESLCEFP